MASPVPEGDDPRSMRNFTAACVDAVRSASRRIRKIHLEAEVIRKLRSTMLPSIKTREALDEALRVVIDGIAQKVALDNARKNVRYAYIRDWLLQQEQEEENEFKVEGEINTAPTWNVRKVLDSFRQDGKTYFLVDWEPTVEPRANIPSTVIAAFYRERRALVRRTYIDDEATEE
ncbi:hypothetical protein P43SY_011812 [Pythium insidiosum]|uniref:Chromo domain-containing protein n=1 Tax=Pythium insidiosum TaxID=114742 RepID=A0AAD5LPB2_PYTIN|nr:hypothetical protein P43SY_011812 [Pythium insidiosum]